MRWIQQGDEMINLNAARTIRFYPKGDGLGAAPALQVILSDDDGRIIRGPAAAKIWFLMEYHEAGTRKKIVPTSRQRKLFEAIHDAVPLSYRSPDPCEAVDLFDIFDVDVDDPEAVKARLERVNEVLRT